MLAVLCAGMACNLGTRSPTIVFQIPSPTPGGPTAEPTVEFPTVTGTIVPPTEAPTATPATHIYAVVLIAEGGALDAHASPDGGSAVAGSLAWDAADLHDTGNTTVVGADTWVELNLPGGGTGWVNRKNLTEYVEPASFCADDAPLSLFANLGEAINASDGEALAALTSPIHGLSVGYIHGGNPRVYAPSEIGSVFTSVESVTWGLGPGSGLPVTGTFNDLVRPDLANVLLGEYTPVCNSIQLGGASYSVEWPAAWKNINFYSLFKPGPAGQEASWMTWLAGVEYVDGHPYLFSLSRYNWEP